MISITNNTVVKTSDHSAVSWGLSGVSDSGIGLSGIRAVRPASSPVVLAGLPGCERNERPTRALEAAVAARARAHVFAVASAGYRKQTTQHHLMWAFRGPEPWSDPT